MLRIKYYGNLTEYDLRGRGFFISTGLYSSRGDLLCIKSDYLYVEQYASYKTALDCGGDRDLLFRVLHLGYVLLHEIWELISLGIQEFWIGESDYWADIEGLHADEGVLRKKGYVKVRTS